MSNADFNRFVMRQQAVQQENKTFDREKRIREWQNFLDNLYRSIADFMQPYVKEKTAEIEFGPVDLNEELLGDYSVQQMLLKIGSSTIRFRPIGTIVIGDRGRVDVEGPCGTARLVGVNNKVTQGRELIKVSISINGEPSAPKFSDEIIEWGWKIMSPPPDVTFTELSSRNFFDMILSVADA